MSSINNVAIIGAGASGLVAARCIQAERPDAKITTFEKREEVGGLWNLTDTGHNCLSTPMYPNLETNIPRGLMRFFDLDFPDSTALFPTQEQIMEYLQAYAREVKHCILFSYEVFKITRNTSDMGGHWIVEARSLGHEERITKNYDAVIVASGHQEVPRWPQVKGVELWRQNFPHSIVHSKDFRSAERFRGKKTLIIGYSASGIDIARQIVSTCESPLYISQGKRSAYYCALDGTSELPEVTDLNCDDRSAVFTDGQRINDIESIICCTGFNHDISYLDPFTVPMNNPPRLYEYMFYALDPTLAFIGILDKTVPWPVAEAQAAVLVRIWMRDLPLPSEDVMNEWLQNSSDLGKEANGGVQLRYPDDVKYTNDMLQWAKRLDTEKGSAGGASGAVMPKEWGDTKTAIRVKTPDMKKIFQELGDARFHVHTLEELSTESGVGFELENVSL